MILSIQNRSNSDATGKKKLANRKGELSWGEEEQGKNQSKSRVIGFYWLFGFFLLVIGYFYWFQLSFPAETINIDPKGAKHLGNVDGSVY